MAVPHNIVAIDQGTTSTRAIVFDDTGAIKAQDQRTFPQYFPQPGWVHHDANEIWQSTLECLTTVLSAESISPNQIAALGITNQRETTVVWERATGKPLTPAIVWQSRESAPLVERITARGRAAEYQAITGLVPDAYFSATKLALMLERDPELRRMAESGEALFGTIDSWLIWNLTTGKHHVTDVSNASRTMLFDIQKHEWSQSLLDDLGIPRQMLPGVVPSSGLLCETDPSIVGVPLTIGGVAGDQQSALFGQACFQIGQAKNTYGTGSFLLMQTGASVPTSQHRLLATIAWEVAGRTDYALEGSVFITGAAVQWLRDGLGIIADAGEVEALAASVNDSGGVMFVPALSGLGAPYWDSQAGGMLIGMTRGTTKAHIARATLEAICHQVADVIDAMVADTGVPLTELRVDGGGSRNDLMMQMQADMLGVRVVRPVQSETTALGAAYLAGLAAGIWQDTDEIATAWQVDRVFEPAIQQQHRLTMRTRWHDAVTRTLNWHQPLAT